MFVTRRVDADVAVNVNVLRTCAAIATIASARTLDPTGNPNTVLSNLAV